jgi:DNA polymerase III epsilon subunit-like protein
MNNNNVIVVDIETTGTDSKKASILSLGAVAFNHDAIYYGECLAEPDAEVSPVALEINGFTLDNIKNDPTKSPVNILIEDFRDWCLLKSDSKITFAGHNIGHFDILFIEEVCRKYNIPIFFTYRTIDLHTLAWSYFGESLSHELICDKLGYEREPKPHNALQGALSEKKAILEILKKSHSFE